MEEVLGKVSLSGAEGAAQFLPAVAEGAGEVEIFIAATEREGCSAPQTASQSPSIGQAPFLLRRLLPGPWGLEHGVTGTRQPNRICESFRRSNWIWIPPPTFRLHAGPTVPTPLRYWGPACAASRLLRVGGCPCAHAQAKRVGGGNEIDICRRECQHMGVPVARDRCLTEEVREGPGFPGCLLCSLPIAQRNTLSEEQRGRGEGGGPQRREVEPNAFSPRPWMAGTRQRS